MVHLLAGRQSLFAGDSSLGTGDDSLGAGGFGQQPQNQIAMRIERQAGELHDEPAVVPVDREAREAVSLAEYKPVARSWFAQTEHAVPQPHRRSQGLRPERLVDRTVVPAIEPDANRALRVIEPARDELPRVRLDDDFGSRRRVARYPLD